MWIEVFRTGEHNDSAGQKRKFSAEMLDEIAVIYNGKVKESSAYEAPLVKGHPKTDAPAYGWIESLKRKGEILLAKLKDVSSGLVDEVQKGMFRKISIALYPDMMLRHVGILGAAAPAVSGLKNVQFDNSKKYALYALRKQNPNQLELFNDNGLESRIVELEQENLRLKSQIRAERQEKRLDGFRQFANSLIENENGAIINPAQANDLVDILEMAYAADNKSVEFSNAFSSGSGNDASNYVDKIKTLFIGLKPKFSTKALDYSLADQNLEDLFSGLDNVQPERYELHKKAKKIQSENEALTYEEAVGLAQMEI